jgi:hypothetical protein
LPLFGNLPVRVTDKVEKTRASTIAEHFICAFLGGLLRQLRMIPA